LFIRIALSFQTQTEFRHTYIGTKDAYLGRRKMRKKQLKQSDLYGPKVSRPRATLEDFWLMAAVRNDREPIGNYAGVLVFVYAVIFVTTPEPTVSSRMATLLSVVRARRCSKLTCNFAVARHGLVNSVGFFVTQRT
jgi:hypothetical protein